MLSEHLQNVLTSIPNRPGVYMMKNAQAEIIYVGKAVNLRNRVRSYFHAGAQQHPKTRRLVHDIADIELWPTDTEVEALLLECNLIKKHRPRYNIRLKDDKRYPYIKVCWQDPFPKVYVTRRLEQDGARYFGPYTSAWAVHQTLDVLRKVFPYLTCDRTITGRDERACLYCDINLCLAPCIGKVDQAGYRAMIVGLCDFLEGRSETITARLQQEMVAAAENLNFERAAQVRDQLRALDHIVEKQKVVSLQGGDQDVVAFAREDGDAVVQMFFIRQGKLIGREYFLLENAEHAEAPEILSQFLEQFYDEAPTVPSEVLLPSEVDGALILERWLERAHGKTVQLKVPRQGVGQELVQRAADDAAETLAALRAQWQADTHKQESALRELQEALELPRLPVRIECYDISNTQGTNSVGSMVVFVQGVPRKADYRRFNIQTVAGPNDFASMREVLTRRFRRWQTLNGRAGQGQTGGPGVFADPGDPDAPAPHLPGQKEDLSFKLLPDLLIVDGGPGQLAQARDVLDAYGLREVVPVVALAKRIEELFVPGRGESILLPPRSQGLFLVQRVRDEAHRFALSAHRARRTRVGLASVLEEIPGVGPTRRKALLQRFGSLDAIRAASVEELLEVQGVTRQVAQAIKDHL